MKKLRNVSSGGVLMRRRSKSFIITRSINPKTKDHIMNKIELINYRPTNIQVHIRVKHS